MLWGAEGTRIQKGKKEQNGYVERSHRTDDEYFYIPYGKEIKDTMSLFLLAYPQSEVSPKADSWIRYYNRERQHFGKELNGMRPEEYLRKTLPKIDPDISLFPPVFLDKIAVRYIQIMWKIERGVIFDYNKRRVPPKSAPAKGDTP